MDWHDLGNSQSATQKRTANPSTATLTPGRSNMRHRIQTDHTPQAKLLACALVLACLLLGVVGLVLPIVPGVLFLAIAGLVAARYFPSIRRRLSRNAAIGRHLERADGILDLPFWRKVQVACLLVAKAALEGIARVRRTVSKAS